MVRITLRCLFLLVTFVEVSMVTALKHDEHRTKRMGPLRNSRGMVKFRGDQEVTLLTGRHGDHLRRRARHRRRRQVSTVDTSGSQRRKDNLLKALTDQTSSSNTIEELDQLTLEVQLNEMITSHGSSKTATDLNKVTELGDENVELYNEKQGSVSNGLDSQLEELRLTTGLAETLEEAMDLVPKFMVPESADRGPAEDVEDAAKMPLDVMEISGDGSGSGETILPVNKGVDNLENIISFTKFDQHVVAGYDEGVMKDLEIQLYEKQRQETELKNLVIEIEEEVVLEEELQQFAGRAERPSDPRDDPWEHGTEEEMEEQDSGEEMRGQGGENQESTESETEETLAEQEEDRRDKIKTESETSSDEVTELDDGDEQQLPMLSKCISPAGSPISLLPEDLCDGRIDCKDGEDEQKQRCKNECPMGYRKCADGFQCLKENLFCNGVLQCRDRSDELDCERTRAECESFNMFSCDGICRMKSFLCDHTQDCSDGEDEAGCTYG